MGLNKDRWHLNYYNGADQQWFDPRRYNPYTPSVLSVGAASDQVLHCLLTDCQIENVIKMKNTKQQQQHTIFNLRSDNSLLHVRIYNMYIVVVVPKVKYFRVDSADTQSIICVMHLENIYIFLLVC